MSLPVVAFALLLSALPLDLAIAAQASVRPRECAKEGSQRVRPTIWQRAREPNLLRYCELLARGHGQLATSPEAAREAAERASALAPERAAPLVLLGRADMALGESERALAAFEKALSLDDRALEEPGAMHAHARALARAGKVEAALATYRALASRVSLLVGADKRVRVLLEAAELSLSQGPSALEDALAFSRQALREPVREARARTLATMALALDRKGAGEEAEALLGEAARLGGAAAVLAFPSDGLATGEGGAVLALVTEPSDPAAAAKLWQGYLAGSGKKEALVVEHARGRLDRLRGRNRR